jgi:hypothetical protein
VALAHGRHHLLDPHFVIQGIGSSRYDACLTIARRRVVKRMKFIAVAAMSAFVLISSASYAVPACAIDGGVAPPECALDATKDAHPDWYRDGGYCAMYDGHQPNFTDLPCKVPH